VTNGAAERTRQIAAANYLALNQVFTQFPDYSTIGYAPAATGRLRRAWHEFWEVM
jgi:hypothetical protein